MARWTVTPNSVNNTLHGAAEVGEKGTHFQVYQDEKPFIDMIKDERETHRSHHTHMKKFATIPDLVAIEILEKWGLDIHDPLFMHDTDKKKRLKQIMVQEYPHLVVGT